MLQQISWNEYWKMIVLLTVLYECSIILLFYRKEILLLAKRKTLVLPVTRAAVVKETNGPDNEAPLLTPAEEDDDDYDEDENLIPYASELAASIKVLIGQAADNNCAKEELIFGLQQLTKDYPELKGTSHQRDINTLINVECKTKCSLHMGAEEIAVLWMGD
jgi:hypothetical protein